MDDRVKDSPNPKDDKPFEFGFGFEIDNIETMKYDEPVYSRPCIVYDLIWKIMIKKSKKDETLGFFLQCKPVSKNVENHWSCYATTKFTIVNKKKSSNNLSRETKHLFCEKEFDWGYSSFHVLKDLYDSNLVTSNSVKCQVSVVANPPELSYTNAENSEDEESSEDKVDENENPMKTEIDGLKSEMNSMTTNVQSLLNSMKMDFQKDIAEMRENIRGIEKEMENVGSTEVRKEENKKRKSDPAIEANPKEVKEMKVSIVDSVVRGSHEKVEENMIKVDTVVTKIPEIVIEDSEILSTDKAKNVDEVATEDPENSIDDFEIVSRVEDENIDRKNSNASSSFEMISENIDDNNRTCHVFEKTTKSDLVIDMVEEHFSNKNNDCPATTADLTFLADDFRDRLLEILQAPVEDEMKSGETNITTNQEKKSFETKLDFAYKALKNVMETYATLINKDMVGERLKDTASNEGKVEKKSIDTKSDVPNSSYRKWAKDLVQSSCSQTLCKDTEQHRGCRETSSVINSPGASSTLPHRPNYYCHDEFRIPRDELISSYIYNQPDQCQILSSTECSEKQHEDVNP